MGELIHVAFGTKREPRKRAQVVHEQTCPHDFMKLVGFGRFVECRVCRAELDPFEVLKKLASCWESATWLDKDIAERLVRIGELERAERNVKARLRRARRTLDRVTSNS